MESSVSQRTFASVCGSSSNRAYRKLSSRKESAGYATKTSYCDSLQQRSEFEAMKDWGTLPLCTARVPQDYWDQLFESAFLALNQAPCELEIE